MGIEQASSKDLHHEESEQKPTGNVRYTNNLAFRVLMRRQYICRAMRKDIPWELTPEDFWDLTKGNCYYCGQEPEQVYRTNNSGWHGWYRYNGVDRKDNVDGYTTDNSVSCCGKCNRAKYTNSIGEFLQHVVAIVNNLGWDELQRLAKIPPKKGHVDEDIEVVQNIKPRPPYTRSEKMAKAIEQAKGKNRY